MSRMYEITAMAYNKKGRLIAVGKNSYFKTHPLQAKYSAKAGNDKAVYVHAELAAILKAREPIHRLVVTRFDTKGNPALAKPCPACQLAIKDVGIKHVEHT